MLTINKTTPMGMRKKVRTKWKADRQVAIRKVSAKRRKKALKQAEKEGKEEKKPEAAKAKKAA